MCLVQNRYGGATGPRTPAALKSIYPAVPLRVSASNGGLSNP